jgi:hypothetical protein
MNVVYILESLTAAPSLAIGTVKLATAIAALLPWAQVMLVACSGAALGWALCWLRERRRSRRGAAPPCGSKHRRCTTTLRDHCLPQTALMDPGWLANLPFRLSLLDTASAAHAWFATPIGARGFLHDLSPHQSACLVVLDTAFTHACAALESEAARSNPLALRELLDAVRRLPASAAGNMFPSELDVRETLAAYDERDGSAWLPAGAISFRAVGGLRAIYRRAFEERRELLKSRGLQSGGAERANFSESLPTVRVVLNDLSPHQSACLVVLDTAFIHMSGEPVYSETARSNAPAIRELLDAIRKLPASASADTLTRGQEVRDMLKVYDSTSLRRFGGLHGIYCRAFDWHAARCARRMPQWEGMRL